MSSPASTKLRILFAFPCNMFFFTINHHSFWRAAAEVLVYLLFFIAVVAAIVFLLRKPMRQYKSVDLRIFKKLEGWHTVKNNRLMTALTYLGKHNFLIPANLIFIAAFLLFGRHYWYAFRILVMSLSSLSLMFILKHLFHRKRPLVPLLNTAKGKSFPSGHAIMSVNFYGLLLYMLLHTGMPSSVKTAASIIIITLIIAIGFSRVYLQVHYASDVLAGFIIGCCWFYTSLHILNRLQFMLSGLRT